MAITTRQVLANTQPRPGPSWDALKQDVRVWGFSQGVNPGSPDLFTAATLRRTDRHAAGPVQSPRSPNSAERSRSPRARPLTLIAESRSQTDAPAVDPEFQAPRREHVKLGGSPGSGSAAARSALTIHRPAQRMSRTAGLRRQGSEGGGAGQHSGRLAERRAGGGEVGWGEELGPQGWCCRGGCGRPPTPWKRRGGPGRPLAERGQGPAGVSACRLPVEREAQAPRGPRLGRHRPPLAPAGGAELGGPKGGPAVGGNQVPKRRKNPQCILLGIFHIDGRKYSGYQVNPIEGQGDEKRLNIAMYKPSALSKTTTSFTSTGTLGTRIYLIVTARRLGVIPEFILFSSSVFPLHLQSVAKFCHPDS
ncbi:uncharacterized protein LOC102161210 [Sus scrofa]|uniref:uncharacterized protein LOC102161210 n=1 Tax=Sus scrofa TaxID=9823 RepID=UPI000A2B185D|nr:uncharacterized protein LOC102161210 [Sus scrofa]